MGVIVGFGEVMVLLQPAPGDRLATAARWDVHIAGAEFNACVAAAALGTPVAFCTRLGDDPPAERIRVAAAMAGVKLLDAVDTSRRTGLFLKEALPDGERRVYYYRNESAASALDVADADRGFGVEPRMVLLSGLTAALGDGPARMMAKVADLAAGRGATVALDVNLRPQLGRLNESIEVVRGLLPLTEVLVVSTADGPALFGTGDPDGIGHAARAAGAREVVITGGAEGSWWQDEAGSMHHQPSLAEEVVDPVGAGDAFVGGYLAARLAGLGAAGASRAGSELAARVIAKPGDTAGLPSVSEGSALLQQLSGEGSA